MSDDDRDIDIESDDDDDGSLNAATQFMTQSEKRAHHNALERKRRDHIKESFSSLRDSVPSLQAEKVHASRAQILKQATEYIQFMTKKNTTIQTDIDDLKQQNSLLDQQVRALEKAKCTGVFALNSTGSLDTKGSYDDPSGSDTEPSDHEVVTTGHKRKRLKTKAN